MTFLTIFFLIPIGMVTTQWPLSRQMQPPEMSNQQQNSWNNEPSKQSANFRQYLYTPSMPPTMPSRQSGMGWNSYNQPQSQQSINNPQNFRALTKARQSQRDRERDYVDYPFTIEYLDRKNPSRKVSKTDENLVDIPFTVEFVNRGTANNPSGRGITYQNQGQGYQNVNSNNPQSFQFKSPNQMQNQRNSQLQQPPSFSAPESSWNNNPGFGRGNSVTGTGNNRNCNSMRCGMGGYS